MSKQAFKRVRKSLGMEVCRKPLDAFAWPGGYPLFYFFADNSVCCPACANANIDLIGAAKRDGDAQWHLVGADINYEDESCTCEVCGKQIESAYGDPVSSQAD